MSAEPHAITDDDRLGLAGAGLALLEVERMVHGEQPDHRGDPYVIANSDRTVIKHDAIEVDVGVGADRDIPSDLAAEIRFDEHILAHGGEQLLHQFPTMLDLFVISAVVLGEQTLGLSALAFNLRIRILIDLAIDHPHPLAAADFGHIGGISHHLRHCCLHHNR